MAHILVVEDMDEIRLAYTMILEMEGHVVEDAACADDARTMIKSKKYDLILTDLIMPDGDGFELVNLIHSLPEQPKTMLVSGGGEKLSIPQAMELAHSLFDTVLSKPVTSDELKTAVIKVLSDA